MSEAERQATILQLHLTTGYAESYYSKMTDEQLEKEMEKHYGEEIL